MIHNRFKIILIVLLTLATVITGIIYIGKVKKEKRIEKETLENEVKSDIKYEEKQPQLNVISVSPKDGATDIPLSATIEIVFNQEDDQLDAEFYIQPAVSYDLKRKANKIIVIPNESYKQGTLYTFIIKYQSRAIPSGPYSFTTTGPLAPIQDTQPEGAEEFEKSFLRVNHPDVFVRTFDPYETESFKMTTEFVGGEGGHFRINVIQKNQAAIDNFLYWLKSTGLTDEQISELDIIYN